MTDELIRPRQSVKTARRLYLRAQRTAAIMDDEGLVAAFKGKQLAEPGTALPSDFPFLHRLNAHGYYAREDLDGADTSELERESHLTRYEARAVFTALGVSPCP